MIEYSKINCGSQPTMFYLPIYKYVLGSVITSCNEAYIRETKCY